MLLEKISKEIQELIVRERRIVRSTIFTTWIIGIIVAVVGSGLSGWMWLWALVVPVVINIFILNNAYHRIARETGLDPRFVHKLWRELQKADIRAI